jgi:hypothetical protein
MHSTFFLNVVDCSNRSYIVRFIFFFFIIIYYKYMISIAVMLKLCDNIGNVAVLMVKYLGECKEK